MMEYELYARRFRSRTIGFRCSPEENEQINFAVSLSGLEKQEFIILYDRLGEFLEELRRIEAGGYIDEELMENISLIAEMVEKLYVG